MATLHYCSDGSRVSQATIDRKRSEAYKKKYEGVTVAPMCSACGIRQSEHSDHTIAQARCKVIHKTELIWHFGNFERSCPICHRQWEGFKTGEWCLHANVEKRLSFLKEHDPEGYQVRVELTKHMLENGTQNQND